MSSRTLKMNYRNYAWRVGFGFMLIDLVLWLVMKIVGSGYVSFLNSADLNSSLSSILASIWNLIHAPVNFIIVPYLLPFIPSHGGGLEAIFAISIYLILCLFQVFIIGFMIGKFIEKVKS